MPKRVYIQCSAKVNKKSVRRETIDGVEHIIVSSKTLPDNVVMNGGLYPAEEIEKSFTGLERTLAPVEHPADKDGGFLPASDPYSIANFYAGAYNENVRRENGIVLVDKVINVQEALKSDRGKRLLDRINELETSENPRPIHTSTGLFLEVEEVEGVKMNAQGKEYSWIARNMLFDHDAILLDSVAAATPESGVGMGVNSEGEKVKVERFVFNQDIQDAGIESQAEISYDAIKRKVFDALNNPPLAVDYIEEIYPSRVIYALDDKLFTVPYEIGNDTVTITGIPMPVEKSESFTIKNNNGDKMKELMLKALTEAGMTVNSEMTDEELMSKYSELLANQNKADDEENESDDEADLATVVANALKPLSEKIDSLETQLNKSSDDELNSLSEIVANSEKYPGIDADSAKKLGVDTLKKMVANCQSSYGLPVGDFTVNSSAIDYKFEAPE